MAKLVNRLTDLKARKAGSGLHSDGDGLYLQVRGPTARCWIYRYTLAGKAREMGLGPFPTTGIEDARRERDRFKRLRHKGQDPIEVRNQERAAVKLAEAASITFSEAVRTFIADKSHGWKNEKHKQQWKNTLKTYAEPTLGGFPVQKIDTALVKKVLDPIWTTKPETASRVRGRIEQILDWCRALGYRAGENPARWKGCLKDLLPTTTDIADVEHHPALPYEQIPAFMEKLRAQESAAARALEWIILTAARANEALKAMPNEISKTDKAWTVPKERMKGRRGKSKAHRVPLPERALEMLEVMSRNAENPYIFQGQSKAGNITDGAVRVLLSRMEIVDVTTHGFRATFKTWATERTRFPREVVEKALAHMVGDETEQAYDRGDLFEKRRKLMEAWASYCTSTPTAHAADNVTSISNAA